MRAHYFQHAPFEGLGSIEGWLQSAGYEITATQFYKSADLPDKKEIDLLVIMGGPMSVNDGKDYPWLAAEKKFIKQVIESGKPVLGICLGAQLIVDAMGGEVSKNQHREIGWYPVRPVIYSDNTVFKFPEETMVFHWHGETFSLPPQAVRIAESNGCENQAFQIRRQVIGLQFHLETTPESARTIVENCRSELTAGKYVQTESEILSVPEERYSLINSLMSRILKYMHE